jgi:hypothetical protein
MKRPKQYRRKIALRQRYQLIQVYLNMGQGVAGPLCEEWGVNPLYAARETKERGIDVRRPRKSLGRSSSAKGVDHQDARWVWAIERGAVSA